LIGQGLQKAGAYCYQRPSRAGKFRNISIVSHPKTALFCPHQRKATLFVASCRQSGPAERDTQAIVEGRLSTGHKIIAFQKTNSQEIAGFGVKGYRMFHEATISTHATLRQIAHLTSNLSMSARLRHANGRVALFMKNLRMAGGMAEWNPLIEQFG
jgi:hypothetical protein